MVTRMLRILPPFEGKKCAPCRLAVLLPLTSSVDSLQHPPGQTGLWLTTDAQDDLMNCLLIGALSNACADLQPIIAHSAWMKACY